MDRNEAYHGVISIKKAKTVTSWIDEIIVKRSCNIAIVDENSKITYSQLGKKIEDYKKIFIHNKISQGQNVVIQMPNVKEYIYAFLALIELGAVPVIANSLLGIHEIVGIIEQTKSVAYLYYEENAAVVKSIRDKYKHIKILSAEDMNKCININENFKIQSKSNVEDVAFLMMSGGTTGKPKIVPITHSMFSWHIYCYCKRFNIKSDDSYLLVSPLTHKMGLYSPGIFNFLCMGGKVILCKYGSCDEWFSLIESEKVTCTALVPTLAKVWMEFLKFDKSYDLSSIRSITIGGAMLKSELISELINTLGCEIQIQYGATEGVSIYSVYTRKSKKFLNTYKHPISGKEEIRIIKENGKDAKEYECGELIVKGPYTIKNYYNKEISNSNKFTEDGYYRTGDMALWSEKYGYEIVGRVVDQINRAGEKINPSEIESIIGGHPDISEVVSIGVQDELLGERHYIFIKTKNKQLEIREIRNFLKSKGLAKYKLPDQLVILEQLPLTMVNKIDKKKLKEIAINKKQRILLCL